MNLLPGTRQALQASASVALVLLLAQILPIERSYWAFFTALTVLCQTWGESIRKAAQRVLATLGGAVLGTAMCMLALPWPWLVVALFLLGQLLFSYFIPRSYALGIFWVSFMLMVLFGMIGVISVHLLLVRLYDTALGAGIAVAASALIFPSRARVMARSESPGFLRALGAAADEALQVMAGAVPPALPEDSAILTRVRALKERYAAMLQENLFLRIEPARARQQLMFLELTALYTLHMRQSALHGRDAELSGLLGPEIGAARAWLAQCFERAVQAVEGAPGGPPPDGEGLREATRAKLFDTMEREPGRRRALMEFMTPMFYAWKIGRALRDLAAVNSTSASPPRTSREAGPESPAR